ncbi:MAG: hypothetical protein AMXMBFR56_62230 [Polyangiaceae bacterium]
MAKKRSLDMTGSPISADGWQALFFETDRRGYVADNTITVVRVACWANCGGQVVGLIPTLEGLRPADEEDNFRGYVDERVKDSVKRAVQAWDEENEPDPEEDDDDEDDDDDDDGEEEPD